MNAMLNFKEKDEIGRFISEKGIKILNLCHISEDGRLKTLSFTATNRKKVDEILELGERVDGSNLFSFIEPGKSDIYIMPKLDKSFINPFAKLPTINILCDYLDENGKPLEVAPKNILARAEEKLHSSSGIVPRALAELEFYVISKQKPEMLFLGFPDKNYHESAPFAYFEDIRNEVLETLTNIGIAVKYGHSEVGRIIGENGILMEQHEVEFAPRNLADMAEAVAVAKWAIRNICAKYGVSASFSPKIALEHAGNGMHIHICGLKNGKNVIVNSDRTLSSEARKMIGGILKFAPSLSAFGNPTPVSYLRFIARKESPTQICWSTRNRLALIRIPLWWSFRETRGDIDDCRETFEYRAPDAFANTYLLLAGITIAADYGLRNPKEALKITEDLHIEETQDRRKPLNFLPHSCRESAENLEKDRQLYEASGVFPRKLIDKTIENLKSYKDKTLWKELTDRPNKIENLLSQYLYYG
jgi:glutamine synthetase